MDYLIIGFAGFLGSILRYSFYVAEKTFLGNHFPIATLIINSLGCLLGGSIMGYESNLSTSSTHFIRLISIGFIGSFTTFSAISSETFKFFDANMQLAALANILLNLILGFTFFSLGRSIFR